MVNLSSLWSQCHHPSPDISPGHIYLVSFILDPSNPVSTVKVAIFAIQIWSHNANLIILGSKIFNDFPIPSALRSSSFSEPDSYHLSSLLSSSSQFLTSNCIWPFSVLQTSCSHPPLNLHTLYSLCELTCLLFTCLSALSILSVKTLLDHSPLRTDPLPYASVFCNTPA